MKHIFEASDIKTGMFVKRIDKIGVISWDGWDNSDGEFGTKNCKRKIYLTEINTDGMIRPMGTTFEEAAIYLTKGEWLLINNPLK